LATQPWKLADANYAQIKAAHYEVAVLPLGATEPHNLHLPYGTDTFEASTIGEQICSAAAEQGAKVLLLPTIPFGTETNQREFPFSMNVNPSTLFAVVTDLVDSLIQSGIRKIVLLNSHGGNEFKPLARELYGQRDAHLFLCFWPTVLKDVYRQIFEHLDDHAGEMETSMALAYFPDHVGRNLDGSLAADDGLAAEMRFQALEQGWVSITRPWHLLTTHSGSGYPHAASAEKGREAMKVLVDRLAPFLVELSHSKLDDRFPFKTQ
jgi:creatinine amidohydrolase